MKRSALDLINRLEAENGKNENIIRIADKTITTLKAENESLKAEIERLKATVDSFTDIGKLYSEIKAEAYKECIEKVKEEINHKLEKEWFFTAESRAVLYSIRNFLDNLLNELVGDGDGES